MDSDIKGREVGEVLSSESGIGQLADAIGSYPLARIAEGALNSNPLHQVIPIDWAEVVRALRTLWLYQISRPENAAAKLMDFSLLLGNPRWAYGMTPLCVVWDWSLRHRAKRRRRINALRHRNGSTIPAIRR